MSPCRRRRRRLHPGLGRRDPRRRTRAIARVELLPAFLRVTSDEQENQLVIWGGLPACAPLELRFEPMLATLTSERTRGRLNTTEPTSTGGSVIRLSAWARVNQLRAASPGRNRDSATLRSKAGRTEKCALPAPVLSTYARRLKCPARVGPTRR